MRRRLMLLLFALVAAITAGGLHVIKLWEEPLRIPEGGYRFTVAPGDSLGRVADRLYEAGVLSHPVLLKIYGRLSGADQQVRRGEYLLPEFSTALSVLHLLQRGTVIQYQVTLPEGITVSRALEILRGEEALQNVLESELDPRLLELAAPHASAEGLFFPDSYRFTRGTTDLELLGRARAAMREILDEEWRQRAADLPYTTRYEALIMASIVERETGLPSEREQIAGVFVRRLQQGMRLQTDPTVIYGLGTTFDGNLRRAHLDDDANRFNTYRHAGLPPTPIALPGRAAIRAALHPGGGNDLYFVARGDGGHEFSATLADHQRAVRKYQLNRRRDYRSTPGNGK